ncbi:pectinesterase family protein [Sphaerisporangium corydalis]|uniref:Pectinesterase n=1 Tax=Sphaerisporangium corydalis TaxID=1441875 RepID=A0ABV9E978_9ACTN|nr:pectinesterase family protein [Sphaerisporangium corydalis]
MSPLVPSPRRRRLLVGGAGALLGLALAPAAGAAASTAGAPYGPRPFGPYGSPSRRLNERTLYVDAQGRGDHVTVQAAVSATPDLPERGWILVIAAGTYRETVLIPAAKAGLTLVGATARAEDVVIVYDNASGTPKPTGGTYGTSGSATTTIQAERFTALHVTFANDWLRAAHPEITATQAVAVKVMGDRSYFERCRFLGHQDTLYADTLSLDVFARQYYRDCHIEGDVDFVFGRATAVFERCELRTLPRDVTFTPYGYVFAPSTAVANPHGYLAVRCAITSGSPDGTYGLARPWRPSSDLTAVPMLTVRETWIGPSVDATTPYVDMSSGYHWQDARFAEYRNIGPGAAIPVPENRPQLTREQAAGQTRAAYLGDWRPFSAV